MYFLTNRSIQLNHFENKPPGVVLGPGLAAKKSWKAAVSLRSRRLEEMSARKNAREIPRATSIFLRHLLQAPATQARRLYVLFLKFGFSRNLGVPFKFTSIKMEHS